MALRDRINFVSLYYTIFEGLAKGGSYLLLIFIASFIDKDLYVKLMLLISLESLLTMFFISYYNDVLYSYKNNKVVKLFSTFSTISYFQFFTYLLFYYLFSDYINNYYSYDLKYIIFFMLGNGFISNFVSNISVAAQIHLDHKKALLYKSVPFFLSFIFCLSSFIFFEDKVFAFFFGKFFGLLIFYVIIFFREKLYLNFLRFDKLLFSSLFKRIKFSFIIAMLSWASGLGFLNFMKLFSDESSSIAIVAMTLNLFTVLQLLSNGINQVYVPQLKHLLTFNIVKAKAYSKKTMFIYFKVTALLLVGVGISFILKDFIINLTTLDPIVFSSIFLVVVLFFINIFQWIATPYLIILNKYKHLFFSKLFLAIISWGIVLFLIYFFEIKNFILHYFVMQIVSSIGIYYYIFKNKLNV